MLSSANLSNYSAVPTPFVPNNTNESLNTVNTNAPKENYQDIDNTSSTRISIHHAVKSQNVPERSLKERRDEEYAKNLIAKPKMKLEDLNLCSDKYYVRINQNDLTPEIFKDIVEYECGPSLNPKTNPDQYITKLHTFIQNILSKDENSKLFLINDGKIQKLQVDHKKTSPFNSSSHVFWPHGRIEQILKKFVIVSAEH